MGLRLRRLFKTFRHFIVDLDLLCVIINHRALRWANQTLNFNFEMVRFYIKTGETWQPIKCHCTQGNHARSTRHGDQMADCYRAFNPTNLHPSTPPPTLSSCTAAASWRASLPASISASVRARTHTHKLRRIFYKLNTHDTWSPRSFGVGAPSACFLCQCPTETNQSSPPLFGNCDCLLQLDSWTFKRPSYEMLVYQYYKVMTKHKAQSVGGDEWCVSGGADCVTQSKRLFLEE